MDDPVVHRVVVPLGVAHQLHHAGIQLREQHGEQGVQQRQHHHPRQGHGDGPAPFGWRPPAAAENDPLKPVDDGGQQIGHGRAVQHGGKNVRQHTGVGHDDAVPEYQVVDQQDGAYYAHRRQTPGKIVVILFHRAASCNIHALIIPNFSPNCKPFPELLQSAYKIFKPCC